MRLYNSFLKRAAGTSGRILSSRWFWIIVLIGLAGFLARPKPLNEEDSLNAVVKIIGPRKSESLEAWKDFRIKDESVARHADARTCLLVDGGEFTLPEHFDQPKLTIPLNGQSFSAAVPIAVDGYLLTGAHCVSQERVLLVIKSRRDKLRKTEGRVVWKGDYKDGHEPDLALIHVPDRFDDVFTLGDGIGAKSGTPVFTCGFGMGPEAQSAGRILDRQSDKNKESSGPYWRKLEHSSPILPGDSGGALFNESGALLGINVQVETKVYRWLGCDILWFYRAKAIAPDLTWLNALMKKDREQRQALRKGES